MRNGAAQIKDFDDMKSSVFDTWEDYRLKEILLHGNLRDRVCNAVVHPEGGNLADKWKRYQSSIIERY